jgi:sugar/nucleoside kinase (ribokinase family)
VIKLSLDDSVRIFGTRPSADDYLDLFLELGPKIVLLTRGKEGTILGTASGNRYQILPNQVDVVDVTGAGDAFWSGVFNNKSGK